MKTKSITQLAECKIHRDYAQQTRRILHSSSRATILESALLTNAQMTGTRLFVRGLKQFNLTTLNSASTSANYIYADHLNTPRAIINKDGAMIWSWESLPFGEKIPNENPCALGIFKFNQRMPGQYFDQETGLFQNWNRDYAPRTGRYVESDPIGLGGGLNRYSYCSSNPLQKTDTSGFFELTGCEAEWLTSNYGDTLSAVIAGFNFQSLADLPSDTVQAISGILGLASAGALKILLPEWLDAKAIQYCPVLKDYMKAPNAAEAIAALGRAAAAQAALLERGLAGLTGISLFATTGLALARNACFDSVTGKPKP